MGILVLHGLLFEPKTIFLFSSVIRTSMPQHWDGFLVLIMQTVHHLHTSNVLWHCQRSECDLCLDNQSQGYPLCMLHVSGSLHW